MSHLRNFFEIYLSRDRYLFSFFSPNYRINCDIYIEQIYLYIHRKYRYMYLACYNLSLRNTCMYIVMLQYNVHYSRSRQTLSCLIYCLILLPYRASRSLRLALPCKTVLRQLPSYCA